MLRSVTASRGVLALLLLLLPIAVYAQVRGHDFVDYDDFRYIVDNPSLPLGFGRAALAEIWRDPYLAWVPLTSLSFQLSHALHGPQPGGYLLGNLAIHVTATLLLFFALARMTGGVLRSAFVAAVFAVHPLNVESVAWASSRKDVLAGLFFALTLAAYARFAQAPSSRLRQAAVALCFAPGLLAKPMLVTVPCVPCCSTSGRSGGCPSRLRGASSICDACGPALWRSCLCSAWWASPPCSPTWCRSAAARWSFLKRCRCSRGSATR
jgi:hypothetical protein